MAVTVIEMMIAIAMIICDRSCFRPGECCGVDRRNGKEDEADRRELSDDYLSFFFIRDFLDNAFESRCSTPVQRH